MPKLGKATWITLFLSLGLIIAAIALYPGLHSQQQTNDRLQQELKESKKSLVKVTEAQRPVYNQALSVLTPLFTTMRTYSSQQVYDAIPDEVRNLLSEDAFKKTNALKEDKYQKVTQFKEEQEFQELAFVPDKLDTSAASGKVVVWYTTKMDEREPVLTNAIYDVSYNQKQNKITSLSLTGTFEKMVDSKMLAD